MRIKETLGLPTLANIFKKSSIKMAIKLYHTSWSVQQNRKILCKVGRWGRRAVVVVVCAKMNRDLKDLLCTDLYIIFFKFPQKLRHTKFFDAVNSLIARRQIITCYPINPKKIPKSSTLWTVRLPYFSTCNHWFILPSISDSRISK